MKTYNYYDSSGSFRGTLEADSLERALRLASSFTPGAMVRRTDGRLVAVFSDKGPR